MHVWLSKCFESSLVVLTILDSTIVSPTRHLEGKRHGEIKQEVWGGENNIRLVAQWHPSLVFLRELTLVCNYRRPMQWPTVFALWAALRAQEILLSRHKRLPRLDLRDNGEVGKKPSHPEPTYTHLSKQMHVTKPLRPRTHTWAETFFSILFWTQLHVITWIWCIITLILARLWSRSCQLLPSVRN